MSHELPIILASASAARKAMLQNVDLKFDVMPAQIDEEKLKKKLLKNKQKPQQITLGLAQAKALYVSKKHPNSLVIGSDQTLVLSGKILSKCKDTGEAVETLWALGGKTHTLNSAVCIAYNKKIIWKKVAKAQLTMHKLNTAFIYSYLAHAGDAITNCVGCYKIEGYGAWLFKEIKGDTFTIMGMPLLPLLENLRKYNAKIIKDRIKNV